LPATDRQHTIFAEIAPLLFRPPVRIRTGICAPSGGCNFYLCAQWTRARVPPVSAKPQSPKNRLRGIIDRVGGIDLIGNIRAIREARDLLDEMLTDAETELSGRKIGGVKTVTLSVASARATAANRTRRETAGRAAGASSEVLRENSVAAWAAIAIRQAGHPLSGPEMVKAIEEQQGHKVKLTTLVGSLYRWVKKKSVFYLARANTFGLIEMKKG
jgi:hypothetical protein